MNEAGLQRPAPSILGRYAIYEEIASGGMAAVHYGRLLGPVGFSRTVAIKRLHDHLAKDPEVVAMFLDEARVAARVRHPNVVPTLDVVSTSGQIFLVMDYVQGESLARLFRLARAGKEQIPLPIVCSIAVGMLQGLHAAHEATNEQGEPLGIVHRDVSPQNVIVGTDGVARVLDFGIAKAFGRSHTTRDGQIKGKLAYMAPEHIRGETVTRAADIYAASVVLWEMLAGARLFNGEHDAAVLERVLFHAVEPPSKLRSAVSKGLDAIVLRGLSRDAGGRWSTARDMARAIEDLTKTRIATSSQVGEWVESMADDVLAARAAKVKQIECSADDESIAEIRQSPMQLMTPLGTPVWRGPALAEAVADKAAREAASGATAPGETTDLEAAGIPQRPSTSFRWTVGGLTVAAAVALMMVATVKPKRVAAPEPRAATVAPPAVTTPVLPSSAEASGPIAAPPPTTSAPTLPGPPTSVPAAGQAAAVLPAPRASASAAAKPSVARDAGGAPGSTGKKAGCHPPYYIDANGVKQYKLECL